MTTPLAPPIDAPQGRGTSTMVVGAVVGAIAVYLFQLIGGRTLGEVEFAPIANLWTTQFLVITVVLFPIEQLTIRRIALRPDHPLRRDLPMLVSVVGVTAVVVSALLYIYREDLLDGEAIHALQGGLLVLGYGMFAFGRGRLAGMLDYRHYGFATGAESVVRLLAVVLFLQLASSSVSVGWSMALAPLVILAWQPFRHVGSGGPHADADSAGRFLASYVVANGASNVILASGPVVVAALGASNAVVSQFFFTLILLRAPFTFVYNLAARILAPMSRMVSAGRSRELSRFVAAVVASATLVSVVGAIVGRWVGPWAVELLFDVKPAESIASLIVGGIGAAFGSMILSQILVARGHTGRLAVGWVVALIGAAAAVALASGEPDTRVAIGFVVGQGIALVAMGISALSSTEAIDVDP